MGTYARAGYWAALVCGVGAIVYGVVSVGVAVVAPHVLVWDGYEQFAAGYSPWPTMAILVPPLVVTVAFPPLVAALYAAAAVACMREAVQLRAAIDAYFAAARQIGWHPDKAKTVLDDECRRAEVSPESGLETALRRARARLLREL
jgi:hypothetical protein